MIHRGRSAVALAALLLAGLSGLGGPRTVDAVSPASLASGDQYDVGAAELERILNYERVQDGLLALPIDTFLAAKVRDGTVACPGDPSLVMEGRAKDIALHEFLENPHQLRLCPTKSSVDAMTAWGYTGRVGEIITMNGAYDSTDPDTNTQPWWYPNGCGDSGSPDCQFLTYRTVSKAATSLMDDPPHRDVVLGAYDRFACGAWIAPNVPGETIDRWYVCMFASGGPNATVAAPTTAPIFLPRAPTDVTATADDASAVVSWDAPVGILDPPVSAYEVTASPEGRTCHTDGDLSCSVTGLSDATRYTFTVRATNGTGTGPASEASNGVRPRAAVIASTFHATNPERILDTRVGLGLAGRFRVGVPRSFQVTGNGGVPANATAVTGNLTVTGATGAGYLSLGPMVTATPDASTLNFPKGDTRANNVTVRLGPGGKLGAVYAGPAGKTAQVVFDVTGYFTPDALGDTYHLKDPVRLLDSRYGNGLVGPLDTSTPRTFQVTGRSGIPANATAVTGNLTVVGQTSAGFAFLGPTASATPSSSTLNVPAGDTRANGVTVKLGAGGTLSTVWAGHPGSTAQLVFDLTGYFTADGSGLRFFAIQPVRVVDSRAWLGTQGALWTNEPVTLSIRENALVSASAVGFSANLTIVKQTSRGYGFLGPSASATPASSTINAPKGDTRANGLDIALSSSGDLDLVWVGKANSTSHFILDVTGYWK
jgi:hypothetical protein